MEGKKEMDKAPVESAQPVAKEEPEEVVAKEADAEKKASKAAEEAKAQEKEQELLLKKKYPGFKPGGGSALLHKRLNKEPKYFDSGDYNMAKAQMLQRPHAPNTLLTESTGGKIPTPENVPPRKAPPTLQSKLTAMQ